IDVVINFSSSRDLVLDQDRVIGNLDFNGTSRIISIGDNQLTINSVEDADNNSFIRTTGTGRLHTTLSNNESMLFPVGNSSYNPVTITNRTRLDDDISVRVLDEVFVDGLSGDVSGEDRVKRTWDIHKANANAGSGLDFVFNWNSGEATSMTSPALYHYENGDWDKQTGTTSVGSNSLSYTGYTGTFSPFAVGGGLTPLPVEFISFTAKPILNTRNVVLNWKAAEMDEQTIYLVQRSFDGIQWTTISEVVSSGARHSVSEYEFIDA